MSQSEIIWKDKKRPLFGLPLSFTTYTLLPDKFVTTIKFLSVTEEEVRLYRIIDVTLYQNLFQRIFNVGTIHCNSADASTPEFDIIDVKNPKKVRDILSEHIEKQKLERKISSTEFINIDNDI